MGACVGAKSLSTLWDPMDCSPLASFVHGILQARILEWVAMPSQDISDPGFELPSQASASLADTFPLAPPGKPLPCVSIL